MAKPRILDANQVFVGSEPNWKDVDPELIKKDHTILLIKTLNWYAANSSAKESLDYFKKYFPKLKPAHTMTVGFLCRMVSRGYPKELLWDRIEDMAAKLPQEKVIKAKDKAEKQQTLFKPIDKIVDAVTEKIDYAIDDIIKKRSVNPTFSVSGFSKKQLDEVKSFALKYINEFEGCSVKEEYAISKRQENAIVGFLRKLLQQIQTELPPEPVRKVRQPKAIPVERIVKNFAVTDYGQYKTVPAAKMHESSIALLFDSKTRRISIFVAEQGKTLSVKSKAIINFDEAKSFSKVLRKPEEQLKDLVAATKMSILKKLDGVKATAGLPKFRCSETTTILKVW